MYTTLEILKNGNACTGGYGRMLSFFTTRPEFKKMPIPIWMVGLVGEHSDMEWATTNAMIVDPETFADFRRRTLLSVFKCLFWKQYTDSWSSVRNKIQREAIKEAMGLQTYEEVEAYLIKWNRYHFSAPLWNEVLESDTFTKPHQYIYFVQRHIHQTATLKHRRFCKSLTSNDTYFPKYEGSPAERFAMLCTGLDPYSALMEVMVASKLAAKRGVQLSVMEEGGTKKYMATISLSDPRKIFRIAHVLGGSDMTLLEISGVNDLINEAENHFSTTHDLIDETDAVQRLREMVSKHEHADQSATAATTVPSKSGTKFFDDDDDAGDKDTPVVDDEEVVSPSNSRTALRGRTVRPPITSRRRRDVEEDEDEEDALP